MRLQETIAALVLATSPAAISAQQQIRELETVTVQGSPSSVAGTYESLMRGLRTFHEKRGHFSPESSLSYRISKSTSELYVDVDGSLVPIALKSDNTFSLPLPNVRSGPWKLVVFGTGTEVVPVVESLSTTDSSIRLGDLRLQCEVLWSMVEPDVPVMKRAALKMSGGLCGSSIVAVIVPTEREIGQAMLEYNKVVTPIKIAWDHLGFVAPLKDRKIGNDATISLTYK